MAANQRRATGQGDADVQVVRVFQGAGAEHAVGVDHGVGLGPDDLFAGFRCTVEQVGGARETQLRAHCHVRVAQGTGRFPEGRVDAQFAPAALVDGDRIEGGWHPDLCSPLHQLFGKAQARRPGVDAAIDVGLGDIHQAVGTLQFGHAQDDLHGHLGGLALLAVEQRPIEPGEFERGCARCAGQWRSGCPPGILRRLWEQFQGAVLDSGEGLAAQGGEGLPADAQHRQGTLENDLGHQHAQGEDFIRFSQHQGSGCMAVADQLHQHTAAGARATATGNGQHPAGQVFTAEGVVAVDDFPAERVDPTPETQADVGEQQGALCGARDQAAPGQSGWPRHTGHLSSRPVARSGW
ncbi:hypothetical protein D3C85_1109710 [compost metagenome]